MLSNSALGGHNVAQSACPNTKQPSLERGGCYKEGKTLSMETREQVTRPVVA